MEKYWTKEGKKRMNEEDRKMRRTSGETFKRATMRGERERDRERNNEMRKWNSFLLEERNYEIKIKNNMKRKTKGNGSRVGSEHVCLCGCVYTGK